MSLLQVLCHRIGGQVGLQQPQSFRVCVRVLRTSAKKPPPKPKWLASPPTFCAVRALIAANSAVFVTWCYADFVRDENLQYLLTWNFTFGTLDFLRGNFWSFLLCNISQRDVLHFAVNMFVLHQFGLPLARIVGQAGFLRLYLLAGAFSSLSHVVYEVGVVPRLVDSGRRPSEVRMLGASGVVLSCMTVLTALQPRAPVALFGIVEMPLIVAMTGMFFLNVYLGSSAENAHGIAAEGHLGGIVFGLLYYMVAVRRGKLPPPTWK
eukprot:m.140736 g.140736  ORF g.140736 m.140736 type:complete len:264 (+) comp20349_c0_seq7:219-1010(+)